MDTFDSHSEETMGYHVFLMPSGELAAELNSIITQLAEEYGSPVFAPHVTLLARIPSTNDEEVLGKACTLAADMHSLTLTLGELQSTDAYYKALYAEIVEQDAMRSLHKKASAVFGTEPNPAYQAHLSLLYGNYTEERKEQTRNTLSVPHTSFTANSLHVFRTMGAVGKWQEIGVIPFG